jgi:hypothetical protein
MSRGAPDYWSTSYLSKIAFAAGQTQWREYGEAFTSSDGNSTLISYTVPADTILVVITGFASCSFPSKNRLRLRIDTVDFMDIYFDTYAVLPVSDAGILQLNETQLFEAIAYNQTDRVGQKYATAFFGYEETQTQ